MLDELKEKGIEFRAHAIPARLNSENAINHHAIRRRIGSDSDKKKYQKLHWGNIDNFPLISSNIASFLDLLAFSDNL